jgi:hypothetical protein
MERPRISRRQGEARDVNLCENVGLNILTGQGKKYFTVEDS